MSVFCLCLVLCYWMGSILFNIICSFYVAHTHSHLTSCCDILHWTDKLGKVYFIATNREKMILGVSRRKWSYWRELYTIQRKLSSHPSGEAGMRGGSGTSVTGISGASFRVLPLSWLSTHLRGAPCLSLPTPDSQERGTGSYGFIF